MNFREQKADGPGPPAADAAWAGGQPPRPADEALFWTVDRYLEWCQNAATTNTAGSTSVATGDDGGGEQQQPEENKEAAAVDHPLAAATSCSQG